MNRHERRKAAAQGKPTPRPEMGAQKRRVREAWERFEKALLPPDCSDVQRQETRRAFYAGAFVVLDVMAEAMSDDDEMTAGDEQVMIDLALEREEYLANLRLGRA